MEFPLLKGNQIWVVAHNCSFPFKLNILTANVMNLISNVHKSTGEKSMARIRFTHWTNKTHTKTKKRDATPSFVNRNEIEFEWFRQLYERLYSSAKFQATVFQERPLYCVMRPLYFKTRPQYFRKRPLYCRTRHLYCKTRRQYCRFIP